MSSEYINPENPPDCIGFSWYSEDKNEQTGEIIYWGDFCWHPDNGGPKHGCDLLDGSGRIIPGKVCSFRMSESDLDAQKLSERIQENANETFNPHYDDENE
jgi:hypothetical protein